jgi:dTDP-4-dehydrorhamnose 3,5-epimerase
MERGMSYFENGGFGMRWTSIGDGSPPRYNVRRQMGIVAVELRDKRMQFRDGAIDGVILRPLTQRADHRGWLVELYRSDELPAELLPQMAYVSETAPGVVRGPHEHREQSDCFCFIGPGDFRLYLWDARENSLTFRVRQTIEVGASNRQLVIVPPGVVHAYKNIGPTAGWVFNAANQLYAGVGRREAVDEIRHEALNDSPYLVE